MAAKYEQNANGRQANPSARGSLPKINLNAPPGPVTSVSATIRTDVIPT